MGRHLLVDEKGVPLGITLVGANRHDVSQLEAVLDSKIALLIHEQMPPHAVFSPGPLGFCQHHPRQSGL